MFVITILPGLCCLIYDAFYPVLDQYRPVPKITKQLDPGVVLSIRLYPFLKIEPLIMSRDK